ncbi:16S rRNA (cytosine(1402)-N(4))-methyltransferase [Pokkaliibacter plantistimulans]|uniref:Ribosomal RNA small subunit methyltransferase H n=1 Tax=Proteobacteria bacterium 228 TaxID=2083153 RepID=A0A2S5KJ56_9PROT|nr:16S rRNA (cytosine(1402)-N(4))-methyltransferase RsmH [Pokkaliibacter plantistimulans]PPC74800.1 16S rRNA (cytosine(1402)-N(4))-methyltransferase [Pokkaliibacter plantistimulans]
MTDTYQHVTVLLDEAVDQLVTNSDGVYIDGTFGRGGHSSRILQRLSANGRLIAIDKDPDAIAVAKQRFADDPRFEIVHASFADLAEIVSQRSLHGRISGVLLDLGVSSPQLDNPERGFSFMQDGPLDMRMDPSQGLSAADWVNSAAEKDIADVLFVYGEERHSRRMAKAIVAARQVAPILRTHTLSKIITDANPAWEKGKHPATRAFQAIRIFINKELDDIQTCLDASADVLTSSGRLVVISFHSLEDRIVKRFIRKESKGEQLPRGLPVTQDMLNIRMRTLGKAQKAEADEVTDNVRSRSAIMRVAERI